MISKNSYKNFSEILDGIYIKTLVYGKETLMAKFLLREGAILPEHNHPYEQTGYLVEGNIILYIDGKKHEMNKNDSWCIPKNVLHKVEVIEESVVLEIFSPTRKDYIKYLDKDSILEY